MSNINSIKYTKLREIIKSKRKAAGITQFKLSEQLGQYCTFVTAIEKGDRRLDVVEFINVAQVIGFDPAEALQEIVA